MMWWPIGVMAATALVVVGVPRVLKARGVHEDLRAASVLIAMSAVWAIAALGGFLMIPASLAAAFFAVLGGLRCWIALRARSAK